MLLQTEILRKAGFAQADISQLEAAWNAYQTVKNQQIRQVPHIVCTGIYNAGKSTLLNTLCGEELFPTGNVPTTKVVAQAEFGGAVYIDTPGLNAETEDDQEAQSAYESADFILFVSHAQNGGISASEAEWLKELREQYTVESLKQRLIYVLTHYGQIEPDARENIETQFYEDLEKALGFRPDKVFCVDSITYQNAIAQGKTLLAEHSAIPQLQAHLAELTAKSEDMLCQAREAELKARRDELAEQINQCKVSLEQELHKKAQESQEKISAANAIWKEFEANLEHEMPEEEIKPIPARYYIDPFAVSISNQNRIEDRSRSTVQRKVKERVERLYNKRERIVRDAVNEVIKDILPKYCFSGLDSAYASCCNRVTQVFNDVVLALQKLGLSTSGIDEISVIPELPSSLASVIEQKLSVVEHGSGYSLQDYVSHVDIEEDTRYERLFFEVYHDVKVYYCWDFYDIEEEIRKDLQSDLNYNISNVNGILNDYWQQFLEKLAPQIEQRKAALKSQIDAYQNALKQESNTDGIKTAIGHLEALHQEVSQ